MGLLSFFFFFLRPLWKCKTQILIVLCSIYTRGCIVVKTFFFFFTFYAAWQILVKTLFWKDSQNPMHRQRERERERDREREIRQKAHVEPRAHAGCLQFGLNRYDLYSTTTHDLTCALRRISMVFLCVKCIQTWIFPLLMWHAKLHISPYEKKKEKKWHWVWRVPDGEIHPGFYCSLGWKNM